MNQDGLPGEGVEREPDTEAGGYIEDDVPAWQAFVEAVREFGSQFDRMTAHLGTPDAAAEVLAGSMLSWMADQRGVFVHSLSSQPAPDAGLDVERLAQVLDRYPMWWEVKRLGGKLVMTKMVGTAEAAAADIAAEYDRLALPQPGEPK